MTFEEALSVIENNKNLIGTKYKGATIKELAIVPVDKGHFEEYLKNYCATLNAQQTIVPYMGEDVDVYVFFDDRYLNQGLLPYISLDNLQYDLDNNQ